MAEFDDEQELWWQPFQKLWHVDDEQWMAERRELWNVVRNSKDIRDIDCEDELRGIRTLFLTGQTFDKYYVAKSIYDFDTDRRKETVRVEDYDRLYMIPQIGKEQLEAFASCIIERRNGFSRLSSFGYFQTISKFYANTSLAYDIIMAIYEDLMGGEGLEQNTRYTQSVGSDVFVELNSEMQSYLARIRYGFKTERMDVRYLNELFHYYESISEYLCQHEKLLQERYFPEKTLMDSDRQNFAIKRRRIWFRAVEATFSLPVQKGSVEEDILNKVKGLVKSDKFPATLRRILSDGE